MDKNESTPQQWIGLHKREGWMDSIDYEDELGHANGGNSVYPSAENCEANNNCITDSRENPEEYPCTAMRVYVFAADEFDVALRSVAGGEPPYTRCGKNMGNDLLVIPCDLAKGHDGPCERNVWPVVAGGEPEQKIAVAEFVLQCLQAGCTAGEIITAIREGKDVPAPPQGKEQK